jgi:hypothetical protein
MPETASIPYRNRAGPDAVSDSDGIKCRLCVLYERATPYNEMVTGTPPASLLNDNSLAVVGW